MSIPIGAAGLSSFSNLMEIRDSAKNLMSLASATGLDEETESLSMSLLRKIDGLSGDITPEDMSGIERVFSKLKQHLEETDPNLAALVVGSMNVGAQSLDRVVSGLGVSGCDNAMDFEQQRSGAGASAWLQVQHSQMVDTKRSGDASQLLQKIEKQMNAQSVVDIDLDAAQEVMEEIKASLVDGIQDMDEIRLIKKLMGSIPGLAIMFPNLIDDLKIALTEFLVAEIQGMSPEDAKMFIREVVAMISEVLPTDILSDDQIDEVVAQGAQQDPSAAMMALSPDDIVEGVSDVSGTAVPTIMSGSISAQTGPILINPMLMQTNTPGKSADMKMQAPKAAGMDSDRAEHAKEAMERVKEVLSAMERLFYEGLNDSGNVLEKILTKLKPGLSA
jgi:hypothetical protein